MVLTKSVDYNTIIPFVWMRLHSDEAAHEVPHEAPHEAAAAIVVYCVLLIQFARAILPPAM